MVLINKFEDIFKETNHALLTKLIVVPYLSTSSLQDIIEAYYLHYYQEDLTKFLFKLEDQQVDRTEKYENIYSKEGMILWHKKEENFYVARGLYDLHGELKTLVHYKGTISKESSYKIREIFEIAGKAHIIKFLQGLKLVDKL